MSYTSNPIETNGTFGDLNLHPNRPRQEWGGGKSVFLHAVQAKYHLHAEGRDRCNFLKEGVAYLFGLKYRPKKSISYIFGSLLS